MTKIYYRKCDNCGQGMNEGYHIEPSGYACSDECLFSDGYTTRDYYEDYEQGLAFYTEWQECDGLPFDAQGRALRHA